jgi:hypothetical protein
MNLNLNYLGNLGAKPERSEDSRGSQGGGMFEMPKSVEERIDTRPRGVLPKSLVEGDFPESWRVPLVVFDQCSASGKLKTLVEDDQWHLESQPCHLLGATGRTRPVSSELPSATA